MLGERKDRKDRKTEGPERPKIGARLVYVPDNPVCIWDVELVRGKVSSNKGYSDV